MERIIKRMIKNLLINIAQGFRKIRYADSFENSTKNSRVYQEQVLKDLINENKNTDFGKKYSFSNMNSYKDYSDKVPINSYSSLDNFITREKSGERNVLTKNSAVFFATSSGTTGKPKFIPINSSFLKDHKSGWETWLYHALKDHPKMFDNKVLALVSPAIEGYTQGRIPFGSMTGLTYEQEPKMVKNFYCVPEVVFSIKDYEARYYCILRIALENKISFIITPNPSTILLLCSKINGFKDELIKDIHEGTLSNNYVIEPEIRLHIEKIIEPNPDRADQLRNCFQKSKELLPRDYWPELQLIGCWTGGSMPLYIRRFKHFFGNVNIRDLGLLCSEGRVTIPISDNSRGGVLSVNTAFFEFIQDTDIESVERGVERVECVERGVESDIGNNIESRNPKVFLSDELKEDQNYSVIMTNSSGLYRYNLKDIVRVIGYHNKTPILEFLNRGEHVTSITGEKLTEWQVVNSMHKCAEKLDLHVHHFTLSVKWAKTPHYELLIEMNENVSDQKLKKCITLFDNELKKLNCEYKSKRNSMRLGKPVLKLVKQGSYEKLIKHKVKNGYRDSQLKLPCLVQKLGFEKKFQILKEMK